MYWSFHCWKQWGRCTAASVADIHRVPPDKVPGRTAGPCAPGRRGKVEADYGVVLFDSVFHTTTVSGRRTTL